MDHEKFDDLVRALGTGTSRRDVLKRLAGGALGGLFGLRALEAGATHKKGHKCNPSDKHSCPEGYTCVDKECVKKSPPKCKGKDQACDEKYPCCDGYYCDQHKKVCKPNKPVCKGKDQACDASHPCCDGYYCDQYKKVCKPK